MTETDSVCTICDGESRFLVIRLAFNDRRPKNVVVLAQAQFNKGQVDIYSPQPLEETMAAEEICSF